MLSHSFMSSIIIASVTRLGLQHIPTETMFCWMSDGTHCKTSDTPTALTSRHLTHLPHSLQDIWHTYRTHHKTSDTPTALTARHLTHLPHSPQDIWHTYRTHRKTSDTPTALTTRHLTHLPHSPQDIWHTYRTHLHGTCSYISVSTVSRFLLRSLLSSLLLEIAQPVYWLGEHCKGKSVPLHARGAQRVPVS